MGSKPRPFRTEFYARKPADEPLFRGIRLPSVGLIFLFIGLA